MRFYKKIGIMGALLLVVIIVVTAYLGLKKPSAEVSQLTPQQQKIVTALEKDTDGDGLKDWEEVLWKTNQNNKDTDGDTIFDGEEVAAGRDPVKAGPDDFLNNVSGTGAQPDIVSGKTKTATEAFARDFFGKYIALVKKGDDTISEDDKIAIVDELLTKKYITLEPTVYPLTTIKTSPDNSKTALRKYGNAIGLIFIKNTPQVEENELTIFENAVTAKNTGGDSDSEIKKLDQIVLGYQKTVQDIKILVAPSSARELHFHLLNSLSGVFSAIESLRATYDDPVRGLPTLALYQAEVVSLGEAMTQLYAYFTRNGVTFTQDEAGYIFASVL